MNSTTQSAALAILSVVLAISPPAQIASAQVLDKQRQFDAQKFWDNRDWDWYAGNIPFFECPDAELTTTYYYRWELLTKHLTYGSPNSGYSFTEFIDRPFWSGAYGAISCPAGHQLYEARWLRRPEIARDYLRYWFRTPGAQPRNYSTWLADSSWAVNQVHRDDAFATDLLPDLVKNYEGWEQRQFVPEVGLFWQTGHDDGMEFNINSRQTRDILRGAPSYRPSFNAYMWADATAIARIARLAGQADIAARFDAKAASLKAKMMELLWDERRQFFFPVYKNDEERDGFQIKALTKTYETGRYAGDSHGRELIGYVPWQFPPLVDRGRGYEAAWAKLMDRDGFYADFGPSTVERNDPMFLLQKTCCWWSGQSWPYATTQTLKSLANVLQRQAAEAGAAAAGSPPAAASPAVKLPTKADYAKLLQIYARSHRKDGRPYLAEALHPDTGSFEGHDGYNHSEHYFHSGFCDLVITGLVGLTPRDDDAIEINPLAPAVWDFFALDDVAYRGHRLSIVWDKRGRRYSLGPGLHLLVDGEKVASSPTLERLVADGAVKTEKLTTETRRHGENNENKVAVNFAVNNDGDYFPRIIASHTGPRSSPAKLNDGNYWYHIHPPNRWTAAESPNEADELILELGTPRRVHSAKLYFLDDRAYVPDVITGIAPPREFTLETWRDGLWQSLGAEQRTPRDPTGRRANLVRFPEQEVLRLRVVFQHADGGRTGLTELELWGDAARPIGPAPPPAGNFAYRRGDSKDEFPKATASHTSRFDKVEMVHDGRINFDPTPHNRWTSYESPAESDWLQIDFGQPKEVARVELHIYDDRGGVQPPKSFVIESWTGTAWQPVANPAATPTKPTGGIANSVRFDRVSTSKIRVVFTHNGSARSGLTEIEIWRE